MHLNRSLYFLLVVIELDITGGMNNTAVNRDKGDHDDTMMMSRTKTLERDARCIQMGTNDGRFCPQT